MRWVPQGLRLHRRRRAAAALCPPALSPPHPARLPRPAVPALLCFSRPPLRAPSYGSGTRSGKGRGWRSRGREAVTHGRSHASSTAQGVNNNAQRRGGALASRTQVSYMQQKSAIVQEGRLLQRQVQALNVHPTTGFQNMRGSGLEFRPSWDRTTHQNRHTDGHLRTYIRYSKVYPINCATTPTVGIGEVRAGHEANCFYSS